MDRGLGWSADPHEDVYDGLPPPLGFVLDCGGKDAGHGRGTVERHPAVGRWGGRVEGGYCFVLGERALGGAGKELNGNGRGYW